MKRILLAPLVCLSLMAAEDPTEAHVTSYELTIGGSGTALTEGGWVDLSVGLSVNPFKSLPSLWLGVNQSISWDPHLGGSTDVNANWSWHIAGNLYLNTGWSAGASYYGGDGLTIDWRTGPEVTAQYYIGNAFIYSGVNYDISIDGKTNGIRYSLGIGLAF